MASYIELSQGKRAIVDESFTGRLRKRKWYAVRRGNTYYAVSNIRNVDGKQTTILMHRYILELAEIRLGTHTDHRNGNGLDNRLENLRPTSATGNQCNRGMQKNNATGYKGVAFVKSTGRWSAMIGANKRKHYLGTFDSPEQAHAAYAEAASRLHGEFANT